MFKLLLTKVSSSILLSVKVLSSSIVQHKSCMSACDQLVSRDRVGDTVSHVTKLRTIGHTGHNHWALHESCQDTMSRVRVSMCHVSRGQEVICQPSTIQPAKVNIKLSNSTLLQIKIVNWFQSSIKNGLNGLAFIVL